MNYGKLVPWSAETANAVCDATGLKCEDGSLALQSQKDECDINVIVERFGLTGSLPPVPMPPSFGDFESGVTDYRSALDMLRNAQETFDALPVKVRNQFGNDPGEFLDYVYAPGRTRKDLQDIGVEVPDLPVNPTLVQIQNIEALIPKADDKVVSK